MLKHLALSTAFVAVLAASAFAHEVKAGDLTLNHPWLRATAPGAPVSGGYMQITNAGSTPDVLVGGSAEFADKVEIHEMVMDGDVMKMRPVEGGLEIPAGGQVELKPGSYHVMFIDLKSPPAEGKPVKGTLQFEKAGKVDISYDVAPMGAKAEGQQGHHGKH